MAYEWGPDEEIAAWKLNRMQIDPLLKAVNNSGVRGGVESSALNSDTIDKDIGTGAAKSVAEEITEHELGNIHYEYDDGNNRWAMRSGSPGVTGKVEGSTGQLEWNCDDFTCKRVNWQKITTDKWGNVICSEQVIDGCTHSTKMWNPKTCDGGEIWRRMGTIEADCKYKLPNGKSALMTWKYKAVNENNAFILPVPRQDGWEIPSVLNVCTDTEVAPRTSNSHWIQTAGPDTGASVPIQGVGEFGGIFAYQAQDYNGNNVGIGLASGIEFYDCDTINCRNTLNPRPKSTTAKVDFGSCGKYGYIQISNVNPKHPWQFQLSGHLDVGSSAADVSCAIWRYWDSSENRPGVIKSLSFVDCKSYIDYGDIKLGSANYSGDHLQDRSGIIHSISIDKGTAQICSGNIVIDIGTISACIGKANYQPMYPQFNKEGIISSVGWCDNYDQINQGSIKMATANWDPGTNGWMQPQRTGGVKAMCWGVQSNYPAIDNGNLIMPVATYYPCNTAPPGVKNRPGLIRGVKAVDCLLPAPFIDECGYLHIRA